MKKPIILLFLGILSYQVYAQPVADTLSINKLKHLDYMPGHGEGEGWIMMGPDNRQLFKQSETVDAKAGGLVFTIEGTGIQIDPESGEEVIVHDAFGILTFNKDSMRYEITSWSAIRGEITVEFRITGNRTHEWLFRDDRGGTIRFGEDFTQDGIWKELGEYSFDGRTWFQFFEMTLKRTGP
jgi:hypothetical protein